MDFKHKHTVPDTQDSISIIKQLIKEGHYTQAVQDCSDYLQKDSSLNDFNLASEFYACRALTYYKMSYFEEALQDATQALEILKIYNQELDDLKVSIFLVIGKVHTSRADFKEALNILNEGLRLAKDFTGEDSMSSAEYHFSIGRIYEVLEKKAQATEHFNQCADILLKYQENKEYHPEAVSLFGQVREYQEKLKGSMEIYTRAYNIVKSMYSSKHPDLFPIYYGLGNVCHGQEDDTSAKRWYTKALKIAKMNFIDNHLTSSLCYHSLGNIHLDKNNFETAIECYNQALAIKENYFPHLQHPDMAMLKLKLSIIYRKQNNTTKALELLEQAEKVLIEKFEQSHTFVVSCLYNKAKIFEKQEKLDLALINFEQALAMYKVVYGPDDEETGDCYQSIGYILQKQEKYKEAIDNYYKALRINQRIFGLDSFGTQSILRSLGCCFLVSKDLESAKKMCIRLNQGYRKTAGGEKDGGKAALARNKSRQVQESIKKIEFLIDETKID